jgi:thiamine pyrophosphate-dependent acetolactate synthase large subunit-like protein
MGQPRAEPLTEGATIPQLLARTLAANGVTDVFGLLGTANVRLVHHFVHAEGGHFHNARHEAGAVSAADGYARVKGRPGICTVTMGPGFTNTLTAVVSADRGRVPLVLIAGDSSGITERDDAFLPIQGIDQGAIAASAGLAVVRVAAATAADDMATALWRADEGRAVVLILPFELDDALAAASVTAKPEPRAAPVAPDPDRVLAASAWLQEARRPVILAGLGAVRAGAAGALTALAAQTGAALSTSLRGIGMFAGHPQDVGVAGGFAPPPVVDLLRSADCVAVFGAGLGPYTTRSGELFGDARVIRVDIDGQVGRRRSDRELMLLGDARLVAEALLDSFAGTAPRRGLRHHPAIGGTARRYWHDRIDDVSRDGAIDPRTLCARLDEMLPANRRLVVDGGAFYEWAVALIAVDAPDKLLMMLDFGAIGGGLGAAIGAAVADRDGTTVLCIGDGAFFMTMGELDLAIRDRLPLVVVCFNDGAYLSEIELFQARGLSSELAVFPTPDLAAVARTMGANALRVTTTEDLDTVADRIERLDGPLFLDCTTTRDPLPPIVGS